MKQGKIRLDAALVERGLCLTRTNAQALIMAGEVRVMQLHDILLLRTSAILPEAISAGELTPS